MQDKVIQFISNLNGQFVEVSSKEAIFQCMDLSYLWIFILGIPKSTIQHGQASEIWTGANDITRQYFELIPNTIEALPQAGDIVVWSTKYGKYGHVGIATGDSTQNNFMVFEQNNPIGTNAHVQSRSYTNVSGWLRPKNVIIESTPQWLNTLLQEVNLTIENESDIRILFEKAKKYNDEVKMLQEQIKSANEQLADKSLEVSRLVGTNETLSLKVDELNKLYSDAKIERDDFAWKNDRNAILIDELQKQISDKDVAIDGLKKAYKELESNSVAGLGFWDLIKLAFRVKQK